MPPRTIPLVLLLAATTAVAMACRTAAYLPFDETPTADPTPSGTLTATPTPPILTPTPTSTVVPSGTHTLSTCVPLLSTSSGSVAIAHGPAIGRGSEVFLFQVVVPGPLTTPGTIIAPADVGSAGVFDLRLVAAVVGEGANDRLELDRAPSVAYGSGPASAAQLCVVPYFSTLTLNGNVVPESKWNGAAGGVIVLRADQVTFSGGILDASATGFPGGAADGADSASNNATPDCALSAVGGDKGGSFILPTAGATSCTNPINTGGGGGNQSRSGAGGGACGGAGGRGGFGANTSAPKPFGVGGNALANAMLSDRLYFGGGGGGGNSGTDGGDGGHGGGIVLVLTTAITGTGEIAADGATGGSVGMMVNAGAGGGGAGGTIRVETASWAAGVTAHANGGGGGDTDVVAASELDGPGGGGGGGRAVFAIATPTMLTLAGGPNGVAVSGTQSAMPGMVGTTAAVTPLPPP